MPEGFLLGLSNGMMCLTSCSQILIPFLLGEAQNPRRNVGMVLRFLGGRLLGYLLFAFLVWTANRQMQDLIQNTFLFGTVYLLLAAMMIGYGFLASENSCISAKPGRFISFWGAHGPNSLSFALGLAMGINLCPPFIAALTTAVRYPHLLQTVLFFLSFFLGTSIFFLPLPLTGLLGKCGTTRIIGKLAAGIVGLYYLYSGLFMIYGGLVI